MKSNFPKSADIDPLREKLVHDISLASSDSSVSDPPKVHVRKRKRIKNLISTFITAASNFSVQYNFNAISVALLVMSTSVCTSTSEDCRQGDQEDWVKSTATATVFVGAIAGQLVMGYVADVIGRNKAMIFTLSLASVGALLSAVISFGNATSIYSLIILCRFMLGIGLGGVYPISAIKAAEDCGSSKQGKAESSSGAAWSFFWQAPGAMTPWLLAYILSFSEVSPTIKWRLLLGLGCFPGVMVAVASHYDQSMIEEVKHSHDPHPDVDIMKYLRNPDIQKRLIVTGGSWFLYDICYYGVNLFGGDILAAINSADDDNISSNASIRRTATYQLIAQSTSIPACICTILLFKFLGLKVLHIGGFVLIGSAFLLMASLFTYLHEHSPKGLFALYCFLLFTLSAGPNVTTFVLPSQTFPKEVRTTLNGISAAMGKLGAVFGAYIYGSVAAASSFVVVMILCAFFAIVAAVFSYIWYPNQPFDKIDLFLDEEESFKSRDGVSTA